MYNSVQKGRESKISQIIGTSQSGSLYLTVISAPDAEAREEVAKHLRYWPYVKFLKYQGDRHLLVCFCLGEVKDGYQLNQLYERSRQLVLLCLRQYGVTITRWKKLPDGFKLYHNNRLFTRPDASLKPFFDFIEKPENTGAKVIPHPASVNQPKTSWVKNLFSNISNFLNPFSV
jgi:hypothetical protein